MKASGQNKGITKPKVGAAKAMQKGNTMDNINIQEIVKEEMNLLKAKFPFFGRRKKKSEKKKQGKRFGGSKFSVPVPDLSGLKVSGTGKGGIKITRKKKKKSSSKETTSTPSRSYSYAGKGGSPVAGKRGSALSSNKPAKQKSKSTTKKTGTAKAGQRGSALTNKPVKTTSAAIPSMSTQMQKPTKSKSKTQPTAMQSAASYKGKGRATTKKPVIKPVKTNTSTTTTKAPKAPRAGSAAASLAANRKEITRRQAAKKLGSGGATRMAEGD